MTEACYRSREAFDGPTVLSNIVEVLRLTHLDVRSNRHGCLPARLGPQAVDSQNWAAIVN